ncbi:MAG TPA: hypothetical protein EYP03_01995, partial [Aquificae bacterium]|nr:hypothetical protein [Aquificota bacterium]
MNKSFAVAALMFVLLGTVITAPSAEAKQCEGSIGNRVWEDRNQDGIQQDDEPGIANVRLW